MSVSVHIPESELRKLESAVAGYTARVQADVSKVVQESATNIEREAKLEAPVDDGRLRSSIHAVIQGRFSAKVEVGVDYGPYLEFGTGQHVEIPKGLEAYAQQFKGSQPAPGGGIEPQPYLFPAVFAEEPEFKAKIAKALNNV